MNEQINRLARIITLGEELIAETNALEMDEVTEANTTIHGSALRVSAIAQYRLGELAGQIEDDEAVTDLGLALMDGAATPEDVSNAVLIAKDRTKAAEGR